MEQNNQAVQDPKIDQQQEGESETFVRWTWYLLLASCFILLLGVALSWILISKEKIDIGVFYIPSLICSIVSIILLALFVYFDTKDFNLIKYHVPNKYFKIYFWSIAAFGFAIIFTIVFLFFYQLCLAGGLRTKDFFLICFILTAFFTLVAIGLYRYARYKIDLAIYKRKHGEDSHKETTEIKEVSSTDGNKE